MTNNVQFTEHEAVRWEQFKHFKDMGYKDYQIAEKWGLSSIKQVQRLKRKAKQNGAYQQWAEELGAWANEEFKELHSIVKQESPALAYKVTANIAARTITQNIRTEQQVNIDGLGSAVTQIIEFSRKKENNQT